MVRGREELPCAVTVLQQPKPVFPFSGRQPCKPGGDVERALLKGVGQPKNALVGSLQAQVTNPARKRRVVRDGQGGAFDRPRIGRRELGFEVGCAAFGCLELEVGLHAFKLASEDAFAASVHVQFANRHAWPQPAQCGGRHVGLPIDHPTIVEVFQVGAEVLQVVKPWIVTRQCASKVFEVNAPRGMAGMVFAPSGQIVSMGLGEFTPRPQPKDGAGNRSLGRGRFFAEMS